MQYWYGNNSQRYFLTLLQDLNFLKSESRETAIIRDVMTKLAISNYEIGFEYISNGKLIFKTNGMSLRDAIIDIFGLNTLNNLFL